MEQLTDIRWMQRYTNFHKACGRLLDYQSKVGTPIGDRIDRVGQVFYEAA
jgi:hypothetical protein